MLMSWSDSPDAWKPSGRIRPLRRPKRDAGASGEGGNDADARSGATLAGRGLFRHDGVKRLDRIADTLRGAFLVMAKNASGRMVPYYRIVL